MSRSKTVISKQLSNAALAISNSLDDPEIKALLAPYGYNDEKLNEGQQLYDAASAAVSAQQDASGLQLTATRALLAAQQQAVIAYQDLAKMARAVISDRTVLARLGLNKQMPDSIGGFLAAAGTLFDNAPKLPELSKYSYDAAKLTAERAKITACFEANNNQETAKTVAKAATAAQDAAVSALNKWLAQYIKVARIAMRTQPTMLGRLGVTARTSPTAAQRAAAAKKQQPPTPTTMS
jgi:hypothetical protein